MRRTVIKFHNCLNKSGIDGSGTNTNKRISIQVVLSKKSVD